jgi:hypothetical protein
VLRCFDWLVHRGPRFAAGGDGVVGLIFRIMDMMRNCEGLSYWFLMAVNNFAVVVEDGRSASYVRVCINFKVV